MAAMGSTILDLPNEILDKVFSYLSWSPAQSLTPSCPDLTSISLSCRILRGAVLPTLFRNVRLTIRWVDGGIAEPGLCRLRREAPEISKLIRCVHVKTEFVYLPALQIKPFTSALALDQWNTLSHAGEDSTVLPVKHRMRIQEIASELLSSTDPLLQFCDEDHIARALFSTSQNGPRQAGLGEQASEYPSRESVSGTAANIELRVERQNARRRRHQRDALITCMVSLPPQTQNLIFEAVPIDTQDHQQHAFALQVYAMALKIFASQLQSLTVISRSLGSRRRTPPSQASMETDDYDSIIAPVIPQLHSITALTLASNDGFPNRVKPHGLSGINASLWQADPLGSNVTQLSLRRILDTRSNLFDYIKEFTSLADLTISDVKMSPASFRHHAMRGPEDPHQWLLFLISIRLHRPALRLHLGNLCQYHQPETLPASAIRWLEGEAVPLGANVDFERETRLTEDFGSFISLWMVDDGDRGEMARIDKGVGKLVDDAFTSRWRTFAHLR